MYTDKYNTFEKSEIPYGCFVGNVTFSSNRKNCISDITYEMDYGDTCVFPFHICDGHLQDDIIISVKNFRKEEVYRITQRPDECGNVYLNIDVDISNTILKKGLYFIQVQSYYCLLGGSPSISTLIRPDDCILRVV